MNDDGLDIQDKIDNYLRGYMSDEEREAFEATITSDPALAEQVELNRLVQPLLNRLDELDMRQKFDRWIPEPPPPKSPSQRKDIFGKIWTWLNARPAQPALVWGVPALLALIAVGIYFFIRKPQPTPNAKTLPPPTQPQQPPAQEQQPLAPTQPIATPTPKPSTPPKQSSGNDERNYLALANTHGLDDYKQALVRKDIRGRDRTYSSPKDSLFEQGSEALRHGNYREAIAAFQQFKEGDKDGYYPYAQKRLAVAYHYTGQHGKAIEAQKEAPPSDENDWILALLYLSDLPKHQKDFDQLMAKMIAPAHDYSDKALNLQKKLTALSKQQK